MAERIRKTLPNQQVELLEGRAGIFLVKADANIIWDKHHENDQFPDEGFILEKVVTLAEPSVNV